jgi:hypothetical protein
MNLDQFTNRKQKKTIWIFLLLLLIGTGLLYYRTEISSYLLLRHCIVWSENVKIEYQDFNDEPNKDSEMDMYFWHGIALKSSSFSKAKAIAIFDKNKYCDFIVLLYLDSPNSGHWVGLSRYGNIDDPQNCFIEFFDSYGGSPERVYNYTSKETKKNLGINEDKVTKLLNKCPYNVIYNPVKYQKPSNKVNGNVNTCGRHLLFRNHNLIQKGRTLTEYYDYMNMLKKKENMSYDEIVSKYVDI